MTRLSIFLLLAVLGSALYVVHVQYEARRLYVELEKATTAAQKIEAEKERLEVEKRSQATPLRVEKLAKERLQMRTATPAITQYVTALPAASAAGASSAVSETTSVGAKERSEGPPRASSAPSGGSAVREATSVGATP